MSPRKCCDCARPTFGVRCSLCEFDRNQSPPDPWRPVTSEEAEAQQRIWDTLRDEQDRGRGYTASELRRLCFGEWESDDGREYTT